VRPCFTHERDNCPNPDCIKIRVGVDPPMKRIKKLEARIAELTQGNPHAPLLQEIAAHLRKELTHGTRRKDDEVLLKKIEEVVR
jgi:hypothetical protein